MEWLRTQWSARGMQLEPSPAGGVPSAEEIAALTEGCLLVPLTGCGRLVLTGADRIDFLHGQVSNDVRGLRAGECNRSLLLDHRGHALAELRVLRGDDELVVIVEDGALARVEESLRRHIIFDQVTLGRDADESPLLTLQGPRAAEILAASGVEPPAEGRFERAGSEGSEYTVVRSRRSDAGGFDLLPAFGSEAGLVESLLAAGAVPGGRPAVDLARVCAGLPSAGREAGEGVLPQESGLEELVSYRKGCYLGQEIMARIEARGKLRRQLTGLLLAEDPAAGERDVSAGGKVVGKLGTVARHPQLGTVALAVIRNDLAPDEELVVGGVSARQLQLPLPLGTVASAG